MSSPSIAHAANDFAFGSYEDVLIVSWRGEATMQHVRELVVYRDALVRKGMRGAIHLAEANMKPPTPEVRGEVTRGMQARIGTKPAIGLVFFGSGFAASALRATATALFLIRKGPPTRMFADSMEAAHWLARRSALGVSPLALRSACEFLRSAGRVAPDEAFPLADDDSASAR